MLLTLSIRTPPDASARRMSTPKTQAQSLRAFQSLCVPTTSSNCSTTTARWPRPSRPSFKKGWPTAIPSVIVTTWERWESRLPPARRSRRVHGGAAAVPTANLQGCPQSAGAVHGPRGPSAELFEASVTQVVRALAAKTNRLGIYGDMVDLLAGAGDYASAHRLETFWSELASQVSFQLYCGYSASNSKARIRPTRCGSSAAAIRRSGPVATTRSAHRSWTLPARPPGRRRRRGRDHALAQTVASASCGFGFSASSKCRPRPNSTRRRRPRARRG